MVYAGLTAVTVILLSAWAVPRKPEARVLFVCYEGTELRIRLRFENHSPFTAHLFWDKGATDWQGWLITDDATRMFASTPNVLRGVRVESNQVREVSLRYSSFSYRGWGRISTFNNRIA